LPTDNEIDTESLLLDEGPVGHFNCRWAAS